MKPVSASCSLALMLFSVLSPACQAAVEHTPNSVEMPHQILKSGVVLNSSNLSPNAVQLADTIEITGLLQRITSLRTQLSNTSSVPSLERLTVRQDLHDSLQKASLIIQRTSLEIDFTLAEINCENEVDQEVLRTFQNDRDRSLARINAASFISNGALWAVCESLAIPTFKHPKYGISSGITGIVAGLVPSAFSMYTLRAVNGKRRTSEIEPNMLSKIFNYPVNSEIEYPDSVWKFLHQVPANQPGAKTRIDQLIDHWEADANIPAFNDRRSKEQLDIVTASASRRKGLSIDTLTARSVMLEELGAEIFKMKRMLLELMQVVEGLKQP